MWEFAVQKDSSHAVLITGSTSGIGLAMAHCFGRAGYQVMLHGLADQDSAQALLAEFARYGSHNGFSDADLSTEEGCAQLVRDTREAVGNPSVLINNAGIQFTAPAHDFPAQKWQQILSINLSAGFFLSRDLLPAMRAANWGRIINIASVHGLVASEHKAAYCAAKHGLIGLTKVLALENADCNITANAICPGWVETPLIQPQIEAISREQQLDLEAARAQLVGAKQPMAKASRPEAIGELALYLCGDFASTITGASLPVDGGWTAQ
ncbi:3-hydroxybutyrate dehydrogenase [Microbulbifer elongatus]|uniref:3-hydroxybutyrate dehydrogenase n=1 Tax=Microbulbifer elongatus TaxID=86173 RepID=A0ABT1NYS5_9GAMM|nr:3-hydroxybutyrate dehydrogenase [Microbulbifer elongatus]MCQ3829035.1 3-hydroxybutyrate dehydrogenase [Microbulbifer elongatus]